MKRKALSILIVLCMVFALAVPAYAANNGPNSGENAWSYIQVLYPASNTSEYIYACDNIKANGIETSQVNGITYDKSANTLTLKNFKDKNAVIDCNEMGDDFTVKVSGSNEILYLRTWGYGYGGNLNIKGTGKLTINKNKTGVGAIGIQAEGSASKINVGYNVNLELYNAEDMADGVFLIEATTLPEKAIMIQGKSACEPLAKMDYYGTDAYYYTTSAKVVSGTTETVVVGRPTFSSLSAGTGKFTAKWTKNSYAGGYELQYATNSKFTSAKKITVSDKATVSKSVKGLSKGKTYYVRVRAYRTIQGKKYYSGWTTSKKVRIK